ncbi:MAG: ABC transporter substrate-binding protein [Gemmatimonadales bacterium]|nr:MAG: ABC transporter substrate-binding protein [Gemmatimonadales bacterium]
MRGLAVIVTLATVACAPAGPSAPPPEPEPAGPTLVRGTLTAAAEAEARRLLDEASDAFEVGRRDSAEVAASRIVEQYPASRVSVEALWLRARIRADDGVEGVEQGDDPDPDIAVGRRLQDARADLERLLGALPLDDPREMPARLSLARVLAAQGQIQEALRMALSLPDVPDSATAAASAQWVRERANRLSGDQLRTVLAAADPGQAFRTPVLVAYARSLRIAGDEEGARRFALSALEAGASGVDAEVAQALVDGRGLPRGDGAPVPLGVVLPLGGSPAFQIFARELQEGIEAAVEAWGLTGEVELMILDDGGDIATAANLVRTAETRGAVAVLGLLDDATLAAAADVRVEVPLISPTAYEVPEDSARVFSLNAFDPGAAEALARWAAESGVQQVAIIHGAFGSSADEAAVFAETFEALGGSVLRQFPYEPGATFWESQILGAADLLPEAVVLPVPAEDIPGIAPQVTFFGLDTLGIRIFGTGGWTDPRVLDDVDSRHTDGVVVATPVRPEEDSEGYVRFREAYEAVFQRSLVDGTVRALGYDAASLILQGIYLGAGQPSEVVVALEQLQGLEGATGELSVVNGEIRRRHEVVCIDRRLLLPIQTGELPAQLYRPYQPDPETEEVPEGPGRPDGFACPGSPDFPAPGDTLFQVDTLRAASSPRSETPHPS